MSVQQGCGSGRISPDPSWNFDASDNLTNTSTVAEPPFCNEPYPPGEKAKGKAKVVDTECSTATGASHLLVLPTELIHSILSYLGPVDLTRVSGTCRVLYQHATDDRLWQAHVQDNVPAQKITSSYPCASFRELYRAHDPRWFLSRYKIWFADSGLLGRLILVRYDQRRGCIEGCYLLAQNMDPSSEPWQIDNPVNISAFSPAIHLHVDSPALRLTAKPDRGFDETQDDILVFKPRREKSDGSLDDAETSSSNPESQGQQKEEERVLGNAFEPEILMALSPTSRLKNSFIHARSCSLEEIARRSTPQFPYNHVWPPLTIPSPERVLGAGLERPTSLGVKDCAASRGEVCDRAFRIHKWFEVNTFEYTPINPALSLGDSESSLTRAFLRSHQGSPQRISIGQETSTYATLDPVLYTPTPRKPFRGIWVGGYGVHGCEFLWIHQPDDDDDDDDDDGSNVARRDGESDEAYAARKRDSAVFRGSLRAVKLTGDANVPRGECSFVVDDLAAGGLRIATDSPFVGARIVDSRGHVAGNGFANDTYIKGHLMVISHDRLAHHWMELAHISYFHRVDLDRFLVPP